MCLTTAFIVPINSSHNIEWLSKIRNPFSPESQVLFENIYHIPTNP